MAIETKQNTVTDNIKYAFDENTIILAIESILPTKPISKMALRSRKYKQILSSIKSVGIIEPPAVSVESAKSSTYILLDGHLRIEALKELNESHVTCLVSTDDESFTYNKHINRLSAIQEHKMILRAVDRGVPEKRIAEALGVNVKSIVQKRSLLHGICPEAADLLKDKITPVSVFGILRQMKPMRQIQAATLMNDANIYSIPYARSILAATPIEELVNPDNPKKIKGLTAEQMSRMEEEMSSIDREYHLVEESYGTDVLNLILAKGYLKNLLSNAEIVKYMAKNHAEILSQFQTLSELESLSGERVA
jgi:hypothetical protein